MTRTSWVELCVSDFEQSITWFEHVLGFRVVARDANEYAELSSGEKGCKTRCPCRKWLSTCTISRKWLPFSEHMCRNKRLL